MGYSELFSLSREDVLAAMKDYPEAQEILQALGRKRLMEVKASARHPPHHHHKEHHHRGEHHLAGVVPRHVGEAGKGLVDKIKSEAKVSCRGGVVLVYIGLQRSRIANIPKIIY